MTARITDEHRRLAAEAIDTALPQLRWERVAQAIADAEARGRAQVSIAAMTSQP